MPTKKTVAKKPLKKAVKKAVAKKPVKKTTVKKAANKKVAIKKPVKDLVYASDQESFWVTDGDILNSLVALRDAFAKMDKDIYQFHVAGERNDFSVWVDTVLKDQNCAVDLNKAKSPKSAKTTVVRYLKMYSI